MVGEATVAKTLKAGCECSEPSYLGHVTFDEGMGRWIKAF